MKIKEAVEKEFERIENKQIINTPIEAQKVTFLSRGKQSLQILFDRKVI